MSVSSNLATSVATASKTSVDGASRATSVATRRSAACSLSAAASLGDVASNAVHHALLGDGRHRPLDQFLGAVLANNPVLERKSRRVSHHATCLLLGALAVVWVDELHERARKRLALGVSENRLDGRIHALPVPVEACEDDHLR